RIGAFRLRVTGRERRADLSPGAMGDIEPRRNFVASNWPLTVREDTMAGSYKGACFCGAVEIEVTGEPNAMGYCHCRSCRFWAGGAVNALRVSRRHALKVL